MKFDKKDWINITIYLLALIIIAAVLMGKNHLFASTVDWGSQHYAFPEYFRSLFYETKDIFPDFAMNIGNGQNIYNFAYYGLLSPVVLISYLFPFIRMVTFIQLTSFITTFISVTLFYKWLRNNGHSKTVCFTGGFIFMCAVPLLFHAHRHIMFVNYMPYLILGLIGVDKLFKESKRILLVLSVFLMIMTSFYYSISGIITLGIYFIYKYLKNNKKINTKIFLKSLLNFAIPIFIGILMASIIILPTFHVILSGRSDTTVTIKLAELLIPKINIYYILYDSYGVGLTSIIIIALINLLKSKRENFFLGLVLSLVVLFPIFNYILNATMYIDSKILIPQLPLYVLTIVIFIEELQKNKVKLKIIIPIFALVSLLAFDKNDNLYIYFLIDVTIVIITLLIHNKMKKDIYLILPILIISMGICVGINKYDKLIEKEVFYGPDYYEQKDAIKKLTEQDLDFYRISNTKDLVTNTNNTYANIKYKFSTLYSSTYNINYNKFYYDIINNPIKSRNRVITSSTRNILSLMLMNNKYYVGGNVKLLGYDLIDSKNKIYKNENVLPLAYASKNIMSESEFYELTEVKRGEALLKSIIVKDKSNNKFESKVVKFDLKSTETKYRNAKLTKEKDYYLIEAENGARIDISLEEKLENKILFIRFKVLESQSCSIGDTEININGINNKLTCKSWKYHNGNYNFEYAIPYDNISVLNIILKEGTYKIKDIETYILDYNDIKNVQTDIYPFIIDMKKTKGDNIVGSIDVKEDGYFVASIPYDKGFSAKIDGKNIDIEKINTSFIGFPINKGNHEIEITYSSPLKNAALIVSFIGFGLFTAMIIIDKKKK